jgi:hypothetical protein
MQELPTIEDPLGLPILDEVGCGPDIFLSHAELQIIALLPTIQTDSRMCTPYLLRPLSLFCKLAVDPLRVMYIFPQVARTRLYICYPASHQTSVPSCLAWCISAFVEVAPGILTC